MSDETKPANPADGGRAPPDAVCDGGDLDCGSGLLLIIREAMAPLRAGGVLEVRSRESSVREDLPAWCRLVGHALRDVIAAPGGVTRFLVEKQGATASGGAAAGGDAEALAGDLERAKRFAWSTRVRWSAGMQATIYARNHSFAVGQPASFDTSDAAPSAVEQLLGALGGCLVVGFQWRASRRGIEVRRLEASVKASASNVLVFLGLAEPGPPGSADHPGLASIEVTLYVDADAEDEDLDALLADTLARSPVAQTLARGATLRPQLRRA